MSTKSRIAPPPVLAILAGAVATYGIAAFPAAATDAISSRVGASVDPSLVVVPFCATFALAFLGWGRLADRFGRPAAAIASLAGLSLAGLLLAAAHSPAMIVAGRALEGAAAAGFPPAAQALLARRAGDGAAGRAIGGMMISVAIGSLAIPLAAGPLSDAVSFPATAVLFGVVFPALVAVAIARTTRDERAVTGEAGSNATTATRSMRAILNPPLVAGCATAALVLAAYWTILTRLHELLGSHGAHLGGAVPRATGLVGGAVGIALVTVTARATDRLGPRRPMVAILATGAAALLFVAVAPGAIAPLGLVVFLAMYWGYLPVVSVQVARSAPEADRATALAMLYASMWMGAAAGGALAPLLGGWRPQLAAGAVLWAGATLVAARGFHRGPASEATPAGAQSSPSFVAAVDPSRPPAGEPATEHRTPARARTRRPLVQPTGRR